MRSVESREQMPLHVGSKIGPYEVTAPLGSGGMGVVYRAHDTQLGRDVAIKSLPEDFADDPDRLSRFQREAQVLASLNHRNIAQIYGFEETNRTRCIVMELVEGETLAGRLNGGPISTSEALQIAIQIAEGLEAAHDRGIVHRDLKPANIKITPDGEVKVLDFGLAKPMATENAAATSRSPTMVSGTLPGVILGTAAYMSPEQAKGRAADVRSDIWAFGCVLFEMLAGRAVFEGETTVEILGAILRADPDWSRLPATTPAAVIAVLKRSLQRDRKNRMRDIADARFQLQDVLNDPEGGKTAALMPPAAKHRERLFWLATMTFSIAVTAIATWVLRPRQAGVPETRLQIVTPTANDLTAFAVSPDGRKIVFQAAQEGKSQLWLRQLELEAPRQLPGTENGYGPFWSPDGQSIGFSADNKLKRLDIAGGAPQVLTDASGSCGGAWNDAGIILFSDNCAGPLYRIPAAGGMPVEATRLESRQVGHRFPHFLPDGRRFLFFVLGPPDIRGIYAGSLDSKESRRLFDADSGAVFAPPDDALFARQGALLAQRLDMEKIAAIGDAFSVAAQIAVNVTTAGNGALSASKNGVLAYRAGGAKRQLTWLDRSGRQAAVGQTDTAELADVRLSPDGKYIALSRIVNGNSDVWLIDTARNVLSRFTTDADYDGVPIWSPDSSRIMFSSRRRGHRELYQKPVGSAEAETLLVDFDLGFAPDARDWSPDGRFILYENFGQKTGVDLMALPVTGDRKSFRVAQTGFDETDGRFSPDGRWIAFQSTVTGRSEIYVQPFPGPGGKVQVSVNGGTSPQWRHDGRELFYLGQNDQLMATLIQLPANGKPPEIGAPAVLFATRPGSRYEASSDGQRFLVNTLAEDAAPITVILNWQPRSN